MPVASQVFDDDDLTADDSIGFTDLDEESMSKVFHDEFGADLPPDPEGKEFTLPLTTRGSLKLRIALVDLVKPTEMELLEHLAEPVLSRLRWLRNVPALTAKLRRDYTATNIKLTLHSGSNLMAADTDLLGRGTTSDPYVNMELAGEVQQSTTKHKTLYPEWEETFCFCKTIQQLENDDDGFLNFEVFVPTHSCGPRPLAPHRHRAAPVSLGNRGGASSHALCQARTGGVPTPCNRSSTTTCSRMIPLARLPCQS